MAVPTQIPPPRVPFVDQRTGMISREWYRFLFELFNVTGVGSSSTPLNTFEINPIAAADNSDAVLTLKQTAATYPSFEQVSAEIANALQNVTLAPTAEQIAAEIANALQNITVAPTAEQIAAEIANAIQNLLLTPPVEKDAEGNDPLSLAPLPQQFSTLDTNYIDFELDAPHTNQIGRVGWNPIDQTLDLGMDYGVTQQVGLETYARVENATGVTIPNGTAVGFAGVGANNTLSVSPYNADGTIPSLYVLGVMTHDLPNSGEVGYCTTWGHVRGLDTSAFTIGDVLYVDPTTPGGLTNVKPTAPNVVTPIAAVLSVDATEGEIFVRPTIDQQLYYGEFSNTTGATAGAINTAYALAWDNVEIANGVTIAGTPVTEITVPASGLYQFTVRVQFSSSNANIKSAWVWFKLNGTTDYPNSAVIGTLSDNGGYLVCTNTAELSLSAGDYVEVMWAVNDTSLAPTNVAATAFAPAAACALIAVTQLQQ